MNGWKHMHVTSDASRFCGVRRTSRRPLAVPRASVVRAARTCDNKCETSPPQCLARRDASRPRALAPPAMDKIAPVGRRAHLLPDGRVAYEWEQTLEDVTVYVAVPPGTRARDLDVAIGKSTLRVGIAGNPPYLEHALAETVRPDESVWTLEDGELRCELAKVIRGKSWSAPFEAHRASANKEECEADSRRLMLERFQRENPGFDFSDATFDKPPPDASTFMGGVGA